MTIFQKIVCDRCSKDVDTMAHTVLVYNTGKATVRLHFHSSCFFETDDKGNILYEVLRHEDIKPTTENPNNIKPANL